MKEKAWNTYSEYQRLIAKYKEQFSKAKDSETRSDLRIRISEVQDCMKLLVKIFNLKFS